MSRFLQILDVDDVTPWSPYPENDGDAVFCISEEQALALLDGKALQGQYGAVLVLEEVWHDDLDRPESIFDVIGDAARRLEELEERMDADDMNRTRDDIAEVRADLVDAGLDRVVNWGAEDGVSES
jgi:hypothetical protein